MILVSLNDNLDEILFGDTNLQTIFTALQKINVPLHNIPLLKNNCTFSKLLIEIFTFCATAIIFIKFSQILFQDNPNL